MEVIKIDEAGSGQYTGTLKDETGTVVALANLDTITLTLWNKSDTDRAIINSRNAQDVKNDNDGTVHATSGLFTWKIQPGDNPIVDDTLDEEIHIARIEFTWTVNTKTQRGYREVELHVRNLEKVT